MKLEAPVIQNMHDTVVDFRNYVDAIAMGNERPIECTLAGFTDNEILLECLEYAALQGVTVTFLPPQTRERDYNPHHDPSTYGLD